MSNKLIIIKKTLNEIFVTIFMSRKEKSLSVASRKFFFKKALIPERIFTLFNFLPFL